MAGHGAPGALYLGSLIVRTDLIDTWKKTKQMLIERGIDQNGRFPEVEFFNAVGKYLCKNATVRFVTCNSGEGVEGEKLRKWLQEQLGPNANIKLYEDAVMYIFGVPVHCKKNEMKN